MPLPRKPIPKEIADYLRIDCASPSGLTWIAGRCKNQPAGNLDANRYYVIRFRRQAYKAHRVVWFLVNGCDNTTALIDHIDGDTTNNSINNLRLADPKTNTWNRKPCKQRKYSPYKGVFLAVNSFKKPWRADIKINGKSITIGNFETMEEAARAYNKAALKYFGEFAYQNDVAEKDK